MSLQKEHAGNATRCYLRECWMSLRDKYYAKKEGFPRCCFAIAMFICIILYFGWPLSMIAVAIRLNGECPIQPTIPHCLSATSCIWLLMDVCVISGLCKRQGEGSGANIRACFKANYCFVAQWIILLVLFVWSAVLVYPVHGLVQHTERIETTYCHQVLYNYAFVSTTSMLVPSAVVLIVLTTTALCCITGSASN